MFPAKSSVVLDRQLKVQKLTIPYQITGASVSTSVAQISDEPAILGIKSMSVDGWTTLLESGETASADITLSNSVGNYALLVKVSESVGKICKAEVTDRLTGVRALAYINSTNDPLSSGGGSMIVNVDSADDLTSQGTVYSKVLVIEYVAADGN